MTTEIVSPKTLEERITERLHASIGEIMTEEDLKGIVSRGVEKALFQKREVEERDYSGYRRTQTLPPLVDELVNRHLKISMEDAVSTWLKENPDEIQAAVERAMKAGVADALILTLDNRFASIFTSGINHMQNIGMLPRLQP